MTAWPEEIPQVRPLQTAVLFLVFNRPDTTARVFEAIQQAKPPRLYVAADGPRDGREDEAERVAKVREIATKVDWPCDLKTLFREKNLGCKYAVSGAITWFFEQEEQGIILEDDCLPSQSFFWYCEELLVRYKDNKKVFLISGRNECGEWGDDSSSYFYTLGSIWGWASWRRAWSYYDVHLDNWGDKKHELEIDLFIDSFPEKAREILNGCESVRKGTCDSWAYQWAYARIVNRGLGVVPKYNLIRNIGFGENATHTLARSKHEENLKLFEMPFPLIHNNDFKFNAEYYNIVYPRKKIMRPALYAIKKMRKWVNIKCQS